MHRNTVSDIRKEFQRLKSINSTNKGTLEIQAASFIADEDFIIAPPNKAYIEAELEWYMSQSLNVNDIELYYGMVPKIWQDVSDYSGFINSNYGWCIYSDDNYNQYERVLQCLKDNQDTRHAVMYYTRPSMHIDAFVGGRSDHMCTFAVTYHINENKSRDYVDAHVYMRSNDAVYGYNNDVAWQKHVLQQLADDLAMLPGDIHWHASSLHVYPRHWDFINA